MQELSVSDSSCTYIKFAGLSQSRPPALSKLARKAFLLGNLRPWCQLRAAEPTLQSATAAQRSLESHQTPKHVHRVLTAVYTPYKYHAPGVCCPAYTTQVTHKSHPHRQTTNNTKRRNPTICQNSSTHLQS